MRRGMLVVSAVTNTKDERAGALEGFPIGIDEFPDFSDGNLLDSIDFSDLFMGIDGGDALPDLDMDPEMFAEFSSSGGEESEVNTSSDKKIKESSSEEKKSSTSNLHKQGEEIVSTRKEPISVNRSQKGREKEKKTHSKNTQGKRKVKVVKHTAPEEKIFKLFRSDISTSVKLFSS